MPLSDLQKKLQVPPGKKLKLTINDNRSTMLSVKWEPDCTKVSLHRMFLNAPRNVMQALACYIREEQDAIAPTVKAFIEDKIKTLDYSHLVDLQKLDHQGHVYNVQELFNDLNSKYFKNKLKLNITWFGNPAKKNKSRITFGLYHDPLRLIKVNRMLDCPFFPNYVVSYVIYHEMLHHVCPPYVDENGINRVHNKEFKELESQFRYFDKAQDWINERKAVLFT